MADDRIALAEELLREAVYRSRAGQSAATALRQGAASAPGAAPSTGTCGLGEKAAVDLDLSDRAREIFARLFHDAAEEDLVRVRAVMAEWIRDQDALDRRRNHFLKDFRGRHGADRRGYGAELLAAFEAGLAQVNRAEDDARRLAAGRLVRAS